jgi:excisionase family DNA binding protein
MANHHASPGRPAASPRKIACSVSATALAAGHGKSDYDDPIDRAPASLPKVAYSVPEAAFACGVSRSSLYLFIRSGTLRTKKCGRRTLILHDDLVEFLKALP